MGAGIRGGLITETFIASLPASIPGASAAPTQTARALAAWSHRRDAGIGPSASLRSVADLVVIPLLTLLGYSVRVLPDVDGGSVVEAAHRSTIIPVLLVPWADELHGAWRAAVRRAVAVDGRWCASSNGRSLRVMDAHRTWSRQFLEFDLAAVGEDPATQMVLWSLLRAEAFEASPSSLDAAVEAAARQGISVCRALGDGVVDALERLLGALYRSARQPPADGVEQSLTVLYRLLFLLFAEARGLVPMWHPLYRDRYTVASIVEALLAGRPYRGVWPAVRAISRLAHAGCSAGTLKVNAFNGRLFSPEQSAAFERGPLDDDTIADAVLAVSTVRSSGGRARISYGDLDVEQLGTVYERVLDYDAAAMRGGHRTVTRDLRKSTGTFYTPRALADALVRSTLAPLTAGRHSHELLALRVLDPAMGSGAFLVAACRYLSAAVEDARITEGIWHAGDVTDADRAELRREVALRCLFGVDLNPMAVQLARLSLWLATLAAERPLTFLDHHLVTGDSLVGATPADAARPPGRSSRRRRPEPLPLFDDVAVEPVLEHAVRARQAMTDAPDDTAAAVHRKERALAALHADEGRLAAWRRVCDLWCASWFWNGDAPPAAAFADVAAFVLRRTSALPERVVSTIAAHAETVAVAQRFLHWPLTFPEVFADHRGEALVNPGFDAVLGNPPWDMVRGDSGVAATREGRRDSARMLAGFVREAGVYQVAPGAHVNRYQLFVERALQLTRRGGRIGLILPAGAVADAGAAGLRRHLFDRASVDSVTGLDNRHGIFPIHRGVRFVMLAGTTGRATTQLECRFGLSRVEELEGAWRAPLMLTRRFLSRLSGDDDLGIPELVTARDLAIVERVAAEVPRLGAADGWHVRFGRELNASDDRDGFAPFSGSSLTRPVLEGKQIEPFRVSVERSRFELAAESRLSSRAPRRARLAYRDVASASNRLTLIAAIVPARCVTTHTLFCLKTPLPFDAQHVLCALLNSFVANYLIRMRVNTHVTASLMSRLPVPVIGTADPAFARLEALSRALSSTPGTIEQAPEYVELQALTARLYRLTVDDLAHVLGTFPLIATDVKSAVLEQFSGGA